MRDALMPKSDMLKPLRRNRSHRSRLSRDRSHRAVAIAAAAHADWDNVEEQIAHSIRAAEQRGELPHLAITFLRYAQILRTKGAYREACDQLSRATQLFTQLRMQWWIGEAGRLQSELVAER